MLRVQAVVEAEAYGCPARVLSPDRRLPAEDEQEVTTLQNQAHTVRISGKSPAFDLVDENRKVLQSINNFPNGLPLR